MLSWRDFALKPACMYARSIVRRSSSTERDLLEMFRNICLKRSIWPLKILVVEYVRVTSVFPPVCDSHWITGEKQHKELHVFSLDCSFIAKINSV